MRKRTAPRQEKDHLGRRLCRVPDCKGVVHFTFEAPLQSFDYTTAEAKKFWRTLREIAEQSGR